MSTPKRADSGKSESTAMPGSGRWSSKRKLTVILELLRGADLEATSRKHRVRKTKRSGAEIGGRQRQHRERTASGEVCEVG
jgi:hypothetical protein